MNTLAPGEGIWIKGPPGSGKSHALQELASEFSGEVLTLTSTLPGWLHTLPGGVLVCMDDAPGGTPRSAFPPALAVVVSGANPGPGWRVRELSPLDDEQGMALFLRHAPGSGSREALRKLVRRLAGHPTALIAAARRWPVENLDAILEQPSSDWPGLKAAYEALGEAEREALALLARLPGPAQGEGMQWCGRARGAQGLVAAGWVQIQAPGRYLLPPAVAEVVRPWRSSDLTPYLAWFLHQARRRLALWDSQGGPREFFRSGLWPLLWERTDTPREEWFFLGWSLSAQAPELLLKALQEARLAPIIRARCAARAHQAQGERELAVQVLRAALKSEQGAPEQRALARLELGVALHRLRDLSASRAAYERALEELSRLEMERGCMLAHANLAALSHDAGEREQALSGYQKAIAQAAASGAHRVQGIFCSNLAALLLETQDLPLARATLAQAEQCLARPPTTATWPSPGSTRPPWSSNRVTWRPPTRAMCRPSCSLGRRILPASPSATPAEELWLRWLVTWTAPEATTPAPKPWPLFRTPSPCASWSSGGSFWSGKHRIAPRPSRAVAKPSLPARAPH